MVAAEPAGDPALLDILRTVLDPEVPVLNVVELGVVRRATADMAGVVTVEITPTYSGCPAMRTIEDDIVLALHRAGHEHVVVRTVFSPAWTTDWLSEDTKAKLKAYGIAPPGLASVEPVLVPLTSNAARAACPYCGSSNTERKSEFGSTACKAIHYCHHCRQPFEEFKAI